MRKTAIIIAALMLFGCKAQSEKPLFVATSHPVYAILTEIAGPKAEIVRLVPPGATPHSYEPKPSALFKVNASSALFYVDDNLDGWAARLGAKRKIALTDMLPEENKLYFEHGHSGHNHGDEAHEHEDKDSEELPENHDSPTLDPHFWTDPLAVKALLPALVDTMAKLDPANAGTYRANAELFAKRLDLLHKQAFNELSEVRGKPVFLFHPSFRYMINRYDLVYAGAIETSPGKEPTAKEILEIVERIKNSGVEAIFSEPQLPDKSARVVSESANVQLYKLDPVGGEKGLIKYADLILHNARILRKALR